MNKLLKITLTVVSVMAAVLLANDFRSNSILSCCTRRIKEQKNISYQDLLRTIERGERIIHESGNIFVTCPETGVTRNLKHLNSITANYNGPDALYYLAMDLELAIRNGYIPMNGVFETNRLNRLPNSFIEKLGAHPTAVAWQTFFNWRNKIEADMDTYYANEGQLSFALEVGVENIERLYEVFGDRYGWDKLYSLTLSSLKRAIDLFNAQPDTYIGKDGQLKLAQAAHIREPSVLYYLRDKMAGYSDGKFKWTENILSAHKEREAQSMLLQIKELAGQKNIDFKSLDLSGVDLYRLFLIKNSRQDWESIVEDYLRINLLIADCCRAYGTQARNVSDTDTMVYREALETAEGRIKGYMHEINNATLEFLTNSPVEFSETGLRAREDLLTLLQVLSSYKNGTLREIPGRSIIFHKFEASRFGCKSIELTLDEEETDIVQAGITWKIVKNDNSVITFKLSRDPQSQLIYLKIDSSALNEVFQAVGKKDIGHFLHFDDKNIYKLLIRIFYR